MSMDTDMQARHGRVLAELAEAGMAMVRQLSAAMLDAKDAQTQAQLGLAFHRVSRTIRQTLALEFRLAQDARRHDRPVPTTARPTPQPAQAVTPRPPSPPRERTGWDEYESTDADEALEELDALLDAEDFDLEAAHEAVEACIARIQQDLDLELDLTPSLKPRLSSPVGGGGPAEGRWRGKRSSSTPPTIPLHPAAQGAPPPAGEETASLGALLQSRPQPPTARRSALLGGAAFRGPPRDLRCRSG